MKQKHRSLLTNPRPSFEKLLTAMFFVNVSPYSMHCTMLGRSCPKELSDCIPFGAQRKNTTHKRIERTCKQGGWQAQQGGARANKEKGEP